MNDTERTKQELTDAIDKSFQRLLTQDIKEQVIDFTVLWIRRNKLDVDRDSLTKILDVFRIAIDDAYHKNVGRVMQNLEEPMNKALRQTNPLEATETK